MRFRPYRLCLCFTFLMACSQQAQKSEPAQPAPEATPTAPQADPVANDSPAQPPQDRTNLNETEIQAVFDAWREAQNRGDFEAYASLYASRTYGEKRAGTRVYRFNREGWLKDRKRMFARPITVSVADVSIKASPATAEILFEQTFSQPGFKDSGRKRITLIRENGTLKISTEVMLSSSLLTDNPEMAKDFHFTFEAGDSSYVVLADHAARSFGSGSPEAPITLKNGLHVVFQAATNLPAEHAHWAGKTFKVYALDGSSCETKVGRLALMAAVVPHFGVVQTWRGEDQPGAKPWAAAQIATSLLADESGESLSLVGEISGCMGAFATSPERSVRVMPKVTAAPEASAAALDALRKLSVYQSAQTDFKRAAKEDSSLDARADWSERSDAAGYGPGPDILAVTAERGDGCGVYADSAMAFFQRKDDRLEPWLTARPAPRLPYLVLDLDADGVLEFLFFDDVNVGSVLGRISGSRFLKLKKFPYSFQDCGC